jgi:hypothetical protein
MDQKEVYYDCTDDKCQSSNLKLRYGDMLRRSHHYINPNGNPFGQLEGGHLQVQGPVSALVFDELSEEQLQHRPDSFLWTAKAGSNVVWDDSASEEVAENK